MTQPSSNPTRLRGMIADDVSETRRNTRLMLSLEPSIEVVAVARDGREAVALSRAHRPDVAVMDVNMPNVDGLSAIRAMLKTHPDMACIVMSAEQDRDTLREAMASGAREYLLKPVMADELITAVKRVGKEAIASRLYTEKSKDDLRRQRLATLTQHAAQISTARRTDDEAVKILEELSAFPECEQRWLMTLAMMYVVRKEWAKLKALAEHLDRQSKARQPRA